MAAGRPVCCAAKLRPLTLRTFRHIATKPVLVRVFWTKEHLNHSTLPRHVQMTPEETNKHSQTATCGSRKRPAGRLPTVSLRNECTQIALNLCNVFIEATPIQTSPSRLSKVMTGLASQLIWSCPFLQNPLPPAPHNKNWVKAGPTQYGHLNWHKWTRTVNHSSFYRILDGWMQHVSA